MTEWQEYVAVALALTYEIMTLVLALAVGLVALTLVALLTPVMSCTV